MPDIATPKSFKMQKHFWTWISVPRTLDIKYNSFYAMSNQNKKHSHSGKFNRYSLIDLGVQNNNKLNSLTMPSNIEYVFNASLYLISQDFLLNIKKLINIRNRRRQQKYPNAFQRIPFSVRQISKACSPSSHRRISLRLARQS